LIIFYAISSGLIVGIGILNNEIQYGITTGWVPVFMLGFAIVSWIYIGLTYISPQIIIANILFKTFKNTPIKKRIYLLSISLLMGTSLPVFVVLYNYFIDNSFYRGIHIFISLPLSTISAYIAYRSLIRGLSKL